jgi:hypothetical protein
MLKVLQFLILNVHIICFHTDKGFECLTLSDPVSDLVQPYDFPVPLRCRKTSDTFLFPLRSRSLSDAFPHVVRTLADR